MDKTWYICTMEYHLAMEKDDGLIYATTEVPNPWVTDCTGLWPVRKHATQQEVSGR